MYSWKSIDVFFLTSDLPSWQTFVCVCLPSFTCALKKWIQSLEIRTWTYLIPKHRVFRCLFYRSLVSSVCTLYIRSVGRFLWNPQSIYDYCPVSHPKIIKLVSYSTTQIEKDCWRLLHYTFKGIMDRECQLIYLVVFLDSVAGETWSNGTKY